MVQKLGAFYTQIPCYFTQLPNPGRQPTTIGDPPTLFSGAAYLKNIRHKMTVCCFIYLLNNEKIHPPFAMVVF
jgi:hypothetical protein